MTKAMVAIMFSTHPPWGPEDQQASLVGASCSSSDLLGRRYENFSRKSTEVQTDDLSVVGAQCFAGHGRNFDLTRRVLLRNWAETMVVGSSLQWAVPPMLQPVPRSRVSRGRPGLFDVSVAATHAATKYLRSGAALSFAEDAIDNAGLTDD